MAQRRSLGSKRCDSSACRARQWTISHLNCSRGISSDRRQPQQRHLDGREQVQVTQAGRVDTAYNERARSLGSRQGSSISSSIANTRLLVNRSPAGVIEFASRMPAYWTTFNWLRDCRIALNASDGRLFGFRPNRLVGNSPNARRGETRSAIARLHQFRCFWIAVSILIRIRNQATSRRIGLPLRASRFRRAVTSSRRSRGRRHSVETRSSHRAHRVRFRRSAFESWSSL